MKKSDLYTSAEMPLMTLLKFAHLPKATIMTITIGGKDFMNCLNPETNKAFKYCGGITMI